MGKRAAFPIMCLTAIALSPIASAAYAAPQQVSSPGSQQSVAAPKPSNPAGLTPRTAPRPTKAHRARSKERIYTVTPEMIETMEAAATKGGRRASAFAPAADVPFVGFNPASNAVVGVGLWRVPKLDRSDPNRNNPLRSTRGKTTRAAAVGMQVVF